MEKVGAPQLPHGDDSAGRRRRRRHRRQRPVRVLRSPRRARRRRRDLPAGRVRRHPRGGRAAGRLAAGAARRARGAQGRARRRGRGRGGRGRRTTTTRRSSTQQLARLWKLFYDGAAAAMERHLPLHVKALSRPPSASVLLGVGLRCAVDEWDTGQVPRTDIADAGPAGPGAGQAAAARALRSRPGQAARCSSAAPISSARRPAARSCSPTAAVSRQHLELQVTDERRPRQGPRTRPTAASSAARASPRSPSAPGAVDHHRRHRAEAGRRSSARTPILPSTSDRFGGLLGRSLRCARSSRVLERVAQSDVAVLIEGETGTGKELCAEAIHSAGAARQGAVRRLRSGRRVALAHRERAVRPRARRLHRRRPRSRGRVRSRRTAAPSSSTRSASSSSTCSRACLRALEQRKVKPVGARAAIATSTCASSPPPTAICARRSRPGRFREDLYHRLAVVRVTLPPLRERKEDIPLLVAALPRRQATSRCRRRRMALLTDYDWPGNVRELKNVIERGLSLMGADAACSSRRCSGSSAPAAARAAAAARSGPTHRQRGLPRGQGAADRRRGSATT